MIGKLKEIADGWKNVMFTNEKVEELALSRARVCSECPSAKLMEHPIFEVKETGEMHSLMVMKLKCADCGCPLSAKTRSLYSNCPQNKWLSVMKVNDLQIQLEEFKETLCRNNQTLTHAIGVDTRNNYRQLINSISALSSAAVSEMLFPTYKRGVYFYNKAIPAVSVEEAITSAIKDLNKFDNYFSKILAIPAFTDGKNEFVNINKKRFSLVSENILELQADLNKLLEAFNTNLLSEIKEKLEEEQGPTSQSDQQDQSGPLISELSMVTEEPAGEPISVSTVHEESALDIPGTSEAGADEKISESENGTIEEKGEEINDNTTGSQE